MKRYYSAKSLKNAKYLRQNQTEAEAILWAQLRNRSLNGIKFRRQVPIGKYIADFLCQDKRLIVEIDGSQHLNQDILENDRKRTEYLNSLNYTVIRVFNNDIFNNMPHVLEYIYNEYYNL